MKKEASVIQSTPTIPLGCLPFAKLLAVKIVPYAGGPEQTTQSVPRGLETYSHILRFQPNLLHGKSVLNFGCGDTVYLSEI